MQRSGYSTSTHSKSGTDRNRIATKHRQVLHWIISIKVSPIMSEK